MRWMRRPLIASLIVGFVAAFAPIPSAQEVDLRGTASTAALSGVLTPPLSPRNASYTITARLDPATRIITGSETIAWRNITSRPAVDLQFHFQETSQTRGFLGDPGIDNPGTPTKQFNGQGDSLSFAS